MLRVLQICDKAFYQLRAGLANFCSASFGSLSHNLFFFKQPFRNLDTILGSQATQKQVSRIWPVGSSLLIQAFHLGKESPLMHTFFPTSIYFFSQGCPEAGTNSLVFRCHFCCACCLLCLKTCQFFSDHISPCNTFVLKFLPSCIAFLYSSVTSYASKDDSS